MKLLKYILVFSILIFNSAYSQKKVSDAKYHSFFAKVEIDSINNWLTIKWENDTNAKGFYIKKKMKDDREFGYEYFAELPSGSTMLIDSSIKRGESYEYGLEKWCDWYSAWNYLSVAWDLPAVEYRGRILLLVESSIYLPLKYEIERLIQDMIGDGWLVKLRTAPRAESFDKDLVLQTKQIILDEFRSHKDSLRAVMLLGRIAVPYSGDYAVDGHSPDHQGAWPSDVFYADIDGVWKDSAVNSVMSDYPRQHNIPNDGKFDNTFIPSDSDLEIGRVDFYNLPFFSDSELELLRFYLDKNHKFRNRINKFEQNAIIDDQFLMYGSEAFASTAWSNYSSLFDFKNIDTGMIRYKLIDKPYMFAYGCNSGGFVSCHHVGYATEFVVAPPLSAFYTALGSYFGDWDSENNFLRSALASKGTVVGSFWAGRPFWHIHHLGMGETIGYSTRQTQNNLLNYETTSKYGHRYVHISLMGDPTLRIHNIAPPSSFNLIRNDKEVSFSWQPSQDSVEGYFIYRSNSLDSKFELISSLITSANEFTDKNPLIGNNVYQIRGVRKEHSNTGTYYNQSPALFGNAIFTPFSNAGEIEMLAMPNPSKGSAQLVIQSKHSRNCTISLYDLSGRLINVIYSGSLEAGLNVKNIKYLDKQGNQLPAGAYLLNLESGDKNKTFKVLIE